jgi:hypothetical protein
MKCAGCGAKLIEGAIATIGRRWGFCGNRCRASWAVDRVLFLERVLNRIMIRSRGKHARGLAMDALMGNGGEG